MKILVTGKNSQLGRCLMDQGENIGFSMFGMSSSELDITNIRNVDSVISQIKPDLVINADVCTSVNKAEADMKSAYALNETGPRILAVTCKKLDIPLFHISTGYVFDGISDHPYIETDRVNPTSAYGRSKLMGELAVESSRVKYITLRVGWVFSEWGENFVKTMVQMAQDRDRLAVVADQVGGPVSARSIAAVLLEIALQFERTGWVAWGVYHFCQKPYVSRYQFARSLLKRATEIGLVDYPVEVVPKLSSELPVSLIRPKNSCLDTTLLRTTFDIEDSEWVLDIDGVIDNLSLNAR